MLAIIIGVFLLFVGYNFVIKGYILDNPDASEGNIFFVKIALAVIIAVVLIMLYV